MIYPRCANCGCKAPHSESGVSLEKFGLTGKIYCLCGLVPPSSDEDDDDPDTWCDHPLLTRATRVKLRRARRLPWQQAQFAKQYKERAKQLSAKTGVKSEYDLAPYENTEHQVIQASSQIDLFGGEYGLISHAFCRCKGFQKEESNEEESLP